MTFDVRMRGFPSLTKVDDVFNLLSRSLSNVTPLKTEEIAIDKSLNRILAESVIAQLNLPNFRKASMDGYAIKASDSFGATKFSPILLNLMSINIEIGSFSSDHKLESGCAIRITTGAPVPLGADSVMMAEYTEEDQSNLKIFKAITPYSNIALIGEDVKKDQELFSAGFRLHPSSLSLINAIGFSKIMVYERPIIGILSTGNELIENTDANITIKHIESGKTVDSNRLLIQSLLSTELCLVKDYKILPDNPELIRKTLFSASKECHFIITTGGTSVGQDDFLPYIFESTPNLSKLIVHGVAIKPGKPFGAGMINKCLVLMLPGYPVAVQINYELFVRPLINKFCGFSVHFPRGSIVPAILPHRVTSLAGNRDYIRVRLLFDSSLKISTTWSTLLEKPPTIQVIRRKGAGILSSIALADALLEIPENVEGIEANSLVYVKLLRDM